jgi:LysR family transcriptional regulator, low CO2-responsive transcriptional regulator
MDIDQLVAFDRIVREGSFSRAAWSLHIAQPTISARIQGLEQEVGGPLFTRNNRKISLTALGASFLPYARRAIEVLAEGAAAAREAQDGQRGRLTIGVLGSLAGCLLAPALAHFQRNHPRIECYVRAGSHQRMVELLCDGVVELGMIAWPCIDPLSVDLTALLKLSEPVVLAAPARHPLARQHGVTQQDVADQAAPLLLVRWWQSTHAGVARIAARAQAVANVPPETAREMLLEGVGVGFFTRTYIADALAAGQVREVPIADLPPITRDTALAQLARQKQLSVVASEFMAEVRQVATRSSILSQDA